MSGSSPAPARRARMTALRSPALAATAAAMLAVVLGGAGRGAADGIDRQNAEADTLIKLAGEAAARSPGVADDTTAASIVGSEPASPRLAFPPLPPPPHPLLPSMKPRQ